MPLNADAMFYRVWDVSVARNAKQAVAFYGVHLLVTLLVFFAMGLVVEKVMEGSSLHAMLHMQFASGMVFSILYVVALGVWMIVRKGLVKSLHCWVVLVAGVAAVYMGTLVGLLAPAYLSILLPQGKAGNETGGNEP